MPRRKERWKTNRRQGSVFPNATPAVVLLKIEWQVWEKIRTEELLAGVPVTLHAKDTQHPDVLDRLAEQAGARWNTVYAVYRGNHSLKALDSALQADDSLDPAEWTKIAPNPAVLAEPARALGSALEILLGVHEFDSCPRAEVLRLRDEGGLPPPHDRLRLGVPNLQPLPRQLNAWTFYRANIADKISV